jgi:CTP synthase (UTP-ammonia lyase)
MVPNISIAIVGDFEAERPSHMATNEALLHGAEALGLVVNAEWIPTRTFEIEQGFNCLVGYDGILSSPGGPYKSTKGALEAIRWARERGWPFLGT